MAVRHAIGHGFETEAIELARTYMKSPRASAATCGIAQQTLAIGLAKGGKSDGAVELFTSQLRFAFSEVCWRRECHFASAAIAGPFDFSTGHREPIRADNNASLKRADIGMIRSDLLEQYQIHRLQFHLIPHPGNGQALIRFEEGFEVIGT